jgi:hypothetical protein
VRKRIKQEKEEDDNDEKKEVEVEWKTTTYQGSGVRYNQHEVVIGWPLLWGDFLRLLGAAIHRAIPIQKQPLPIKVHVQMWSSMAHLFALHYGGDRLRLGTRTAVESVLGSWARKNFNPSGAYAILIPPLTITWEDKRKKDHARVEFRCEVFNEEDTILWPLEWDKRDDESDVDTAPN